MARIVRLGGSIAACDVVLELDFALNIGRELNDECFDRLEGLRDPRS
jgi:hypothetical protein